MQEGGTGEGTKGGALILRRELPYRVGTYCRSHCRFLPIQVLSGRREERERERVNLSSCIICFGIFRSAYTGPCSSFVLHNFFLVSFFSHKRFVCTVSFFFFQILFGLKMKLLTHRLLEKRLSNRGGASLLLTAVFAIWAINKGEGWKHDADADADADRRFFALGDGSDDRTWNRKCHEWHFHDEPSSLLLPLLLLGSCLALVLVCVLRRFFFQRNGTKKKTIPRPWSRQRHGRSRQLHF